MAIRDRVIRYGLVGLSMVSLQVFGQATVPEPLEPWREWVLYGEEYRACPVMNGARPGEPSSHVCAWPGELALDVDGVSATFTQNWDLYAEDWVPLPGDPSYWPADVLVGRTPMPVVQRGGRPAVRLEAGSHQITGSLNWTNRPAALTVPRQSGLVSL